ncbi:quinone oxidoreductase [Subtercola boreus]|uniref:Quinone oxidoreductase n=1 Tax=Subtercola boreus TaxID=120213 RepID=A0A3E0VFR0_9MICO|nr:zinc-binding alcohol dehydrogenase family protein [Subtercola boreus]RFA08774.1 quinone oxidoreductase [Subtercola boreus]TQL54263.1 NADPH:quinone reductase-like Zn-dependent oxidoreductase [Subtercola boreus]
MFAAVVTSFDSAPRYQEIATPEAQAPTEIVVDVLAAGLHPRVRSQADGSHYTSTDELPLVPGIDGVGRGPDGLLRYFVLPDTVRGSMAEQTVIDTRRSIVLPAGSDPVAVAAVMNPAMSSWIALRQRIDFAPGSNVLVLGATGSAGRLAVQIAKRFGAASIVAAARNADLLAELAAAGGAQTVSLAGEPADVATRLGAAAAEVDVVLDYLWGEPTAAAMAAVVTHRTDESRPLTWIEIGSVAGAAASIPSAALRASRLSIVGSGQGSVSGREILGELPALVQAIDEGAFEVETRAVPLRDVGAVWLDTSNTRERVVLVP